MSTYKSSNVDACEIKVSSKNLLYKALEMRDIYSNIFSRLKEIENEINSIGNYWKSDNSQLLLFLFKQEDIDSCELESVFNDQINDLNQIISLYEDVEKSNTAISLTLPNDILN